jgi:hypothetical protein
MEHIESKSSASSQDNERRLGRNTIAALVNHAVDGALADGTKASFRSGVARYSEFCLAFGFDMFPVSEEAVCGFIVYYAMLLAVSTVRKYVSGIRDAQLRAGFRWEAHHWFRMQRCLRFVKKKYGEKAKTYRRPITVVILNMFASLLDLNDHDHRCFFAASCMAVASFWRASEFCFNGKLSTTQILKLSDLSWSGGKNNPFSSCAILLGCSKTKWWRRDVTTTAQATGSVSCPVSALRIYLQRSSVRINDSDCLFTLKNGKPLTRKFMGNMTCNAF